MGADAPRTRPFGDGGAEEDPRAGDDAGPTSPGPSTDGRDVSEKRHPKGSDREDPGVPRRGRIRTPARG